MITFERKLAGSWASGRHATVSSDSINAGARVAIDNSDPKVLFTEAGCQKGFMHYTLGAKMGLAMLEAACVAAKADSAVPTPILILRSPKGREYMRLGVTAVEVMNNKMTLFYTNGRSEDLHPIYTFTSRMASASETMQSALEKLYDLLPALHFFREGGVSDDDLSEAAPPPILLHGSDR